MVQGDMAAALTSSIDILIKHEILAACVRDVAGTDQFVDWKFSGFSPEPLGNLIGIVSAQGRFDNLVYHRNVHVNPEIINRGTDFMVKELDAIIEAAVIEMVQLFAQHTAGQLCLNKHCADCYS